jgi:hypothetical protein
LFEFCSGEAGAQAETPVIENLITQTAVGPSSWIEVAERKSVKWLIENSIKMINFSITLSDEAKENRVALLRLNFCIP